MTISLVVLILIFKFWLSSFDNFEATRVRIYFHTNDPVIHNFAFEILKPVDSLVSSMSMDLLVLGLYTFIIEYQAFWFWSL